MSVKEFKINVENCVPHLLLKKVFLSLHSNGFDTYLLNVKTTRKILQIFVAFSEYMNFKMLVDRIYVIFKNQTFKSLIDY